MVIIDFLFENFTKRLVDPIAGCKDPKNAFLRAAKIVSTFFLGDIPCLLLDKFGDKIYEFAATITTKIALWEKRQPGSDEFVQQCENALHLKRIDTPNWKSSFIDGYVKNCENAFNLSDTKGKKTYARKV